MLSCFHCGSPFDPAMTECPACGAEVEMSRLTGILGSVCRACDAYNEPGARACVSCGQPLPVRGGTAPAPVQKLAPAVPAAGPLGLEPPSHPSPQELPPIDFEAVLVDDPDFERRTPPDPIDLVEPAPDDALEPLPAAPPAPPLPFEAVDLEPPSVTTSLPVSAAMAPRLFLERGDGREGAGFPVTGEELSVGGAGADLPFAADPGLASRHATFLVRDGALFVRDEGSAGGTFLGLRGLSIPLRPGDAFAMGDRLLRFAGPLPAPAPPAPDGTRRLGSPRPSGAAVILEERLQGGVTGRVWLRSGPAVTMGRAGCAVNLGEDPYLSQAHAEVHVEGDGTARLRDLGSANGTFVRLPPRAERELRDGDRVRVGRQVLRVSIPS
ncbi:MAG TPA: FHA domain-containing protein [Anaeromyxobacteraceae bacterium]|nr:FHA domain-containing protein [Anaeromyxobacteraceae bacterium]